MAESKKPGGGVSLRTVNVILIIAAVLIAGLMVFSTFQISSYFSRLTEQSKQQTELSNAARELMDASDYLTEKVQRFTVHGGMEFLESYFDEALKNNRRELALEQLSRGNGTEEAFLKLKEAMDASLELMNREYYAMRLVVEAKGYTVYPDVIGEVQLSEEDKALSAEAKMVRASELVHDDKYYEQKGLIRDRMKDSLGELERLAHNEDVNAMNSFRTEIVIFRIVIIVQMLGIFAMVFMTSRLGIHPVLNAVNKIKEDSPIPEMGANEFRYLARTYNKMYGVYRNSIEHLNFKASHDELTGAYNRAGYDLLLSGADLKSTFMLVFDIDDFKNINDTCGHETGDRVLVKLVHTLSSLFRSDDYVCRIGGDEFVVLMSHSAWGQCDRISSIIENVNETMGVPENGMPSVSVSVGIAHGENVADTRELFENADEALYHSKEKGKHTYTFYRDLHPQEGGQN